MYLCSTKELVREKSRTGAKRSYRVVTERDNFGYFGDADLIRKERIAYLPYTLLTNGEDGRARRQRVPRVKESPLGFLLSASHKNASLASGLLLSAFCQHSVLTQSIFFITSPVTIFTAQKAAIPAFSSPHLSF